MPAVKRPTIGLPTTRASTVAHALEFGRESEMHVPRDRVRLMRRGPAMVVGPAAQLEIGQFEHLAWIAAHDVLRLSAGTPALFDVIGQRLVKTRRLEQGDFRLRARACRDIGQPLGFLAVLIGRCRSDRACGPCRQRNASAVNRTVMLHEPFMSLVRFVVGTRHWRI
jgi:hypothetical protein